MGGGPTTPELVTAAASAGGFGFLAAGYKSAPAMVEEIRAVRARTPEAFGVNVFVPGRPTSEPVELDRYLRGLHQEAAAGGWPVGDASWDDDDWEAKLAVLTDDPPAAVSFTFGCPGPDVLAALRAAGACTLMTVTSPEEAVEAASAGADALCVQGVEAGAHQGSFANDERPGQDWGLLSLLGAVAGATDRPLVAAGGLMSRQQVRAVLDAGAVAAQCGTAFLRCPESGAHPRHKDALADPRYTVTAVTRAFSGRRARGLVNRFMVDHPRAPAAYPEVNNATRPMRARAAESGDTDRMSLWAGQGFRQATNRPAGEVVEMLTP